MEYDLPRILGEIVDARRKVAEQTASR